MFGRNRALLGALLVVAIMSFSPVASARVSVGPLSAGVVAAPHPGAPVRVGVASPVAAPSASASPVLSGSRLATEQQVLSSVHRSGVPSRDVFLPNFSPSTTKVGGVVTPGYSHTPAPVGIATYGVVNTTGTAQPVVLNTPSIEGQLGVNDASVFYLDDDSTDYFGTQLNTVLYNVTLLGNSSYQFWTQNVIEYSARSNLLQFLDNIWNFSSPAVALSNNFLLSHSPNGTQVGTTFYYGLGPALNITMPFTLDLYNNASITDVTVQNATNVSVTLPYDELWYNYSVWKSGAWVAGGSYDWAIFNSQNVSNSTPTIPAPQFQVNGADLTGTGFIPDDAELVLCGPGGGSTTSFDTLNATEDLWWWNSSAGAYQDVPSAYNFGSETGETAQGIATWYDGTDTVHLDAGPTLPTPLWGMSPTAAPGYVTISGTVSPANAFIFVNQTDNFSTPLNPYWDSWVPVPANGQLDVQVPAGNYSGEILMSNYDPTTFVLNLSNASTWTVNGSLNYDPFQGIYTPLIAWDNAELASISTGGDGSAGSPYQIANDEYGALAPEFSVFNDYVFPLWPGILIAHTTDHIDINDAAPFLVNYENVLATAAAYYGLPATNYLGIQLYGTSYVSIVGAPLITGWFSFEQQGYPLGDVLAWNTTHTLIAENVFNSEGNALTFFGGTDNVVSGNWFTNTYAPWAENGFAPEGLWLSESGDLIYNNYFATAVGAYSPSYTPYTETYYSSNSATWVDQWNESLEPSTWVNVVNGYSLSGSIVGGTWIGGNFWLGFNGTVPWFDFGAIALVGDLLPLTSPTTSAYAVLTFSESGLPSGLAWSLTLDGILWSSTGTSINLTLANGTYTYSVTPVAGLVISPSSGSVALNGSATTVELTFTPPVALFYTVTFVEIGLPAETAWTVTLGGTPVTSQLQLISFKETNGTYPYTVTPPAGFNASVLSGSAVVSGAAPAAVDVTMAAYLGWLTGVVTPTNAQIWLDGAAISVDPTTGAFNVSESFGTIAIEASASGFYTEFNNVSVSPAKATSVIVTLHSTSSSSSSTSGFLSGSNGVVVAVLAVLLVVFFVAALYFATTRRPPVMMKPETTTPETSDSSLSDGSQKP
jgi:thermopsin